MKAFKQGDPARCGGGTVWGGGNEQADGGDEDDEGEDIAYRLDAVEQGDATGDEEAAHQHGAGDSPEEDLGLVGTVDLEEAEEQKEDEEVVDGHRLFEYIAGEVLDGTGCPERLVEEDGEGEGGGDPERGAGDGGAEWIAPKPRLAASVGELDGEKQEEGEVEADPVAEGRGRHVTMLSRVAISAG